MDFWKKENSDYLKLTIQLSRSILIQQVPMDIESLKDSFKRFSFVPTEEAEAVKTGEIILESLVRQNDRNKNTLAQEALLLLSSAISRNISTFSPKYTVLCMQIVLQLFPSESYSISQSIRWLKLFLFLRAWKSFLIVNQK